MRKNKWLMALCGLLMVSLSTAHAERKEVHILSANDMHAKMEAMPQLADIVDSLRALYPELLVFSAGDNRTGDPLNDMYKIPGYPMVALMNQIGFDATTLGNHEFDSGPRGLARLIGLSNFSYLCANVNADPELGIHLQPCKVFDVEGIKIGVVGAVQLGTHGIPDTHPDNCQGISFQPVDETVAKYDWLRQQCNVVILLSHNGYELDVKSAGKFPWIDLIIGGHTHTQLEGGEMHNGVLITQNVNKLKKVTHITLTLDDGKLVEKKAENISVKEWEGQNETVAHMVNKFNSNSDFQRVLTTVEQSFNNVEELGCMMCDALLSEAGADVSIENFGGVRYDTHDKGPFTIADVFRLDPFNNDAILMEITGEELRQMLISCFNNDEYAFPFVGGLQCEIQLEEGETPEVKKLVLKTLNGKKFNLKKKYKVVTNSYVASITDAQRQDQGHSLNKQTAEMIITYLEKQPSINYQGVKRLHIKK